jgi:hypothetical protein
MTDHSDPQPTLRSVLRATLNGYSLSNMRIEGSSVPYPLVDLLSTDGEDISTGQEQIDTIVDGLAEALLAAAPASPARSIRNALDVDGSGDAALNLEGALDTLLISHGLKETDTVVRTIRRVLGQIAEATRIAEMEQVGRIAD